MPTSIFQKFDIDATVEYGTDHFDVTFVGSGPFRNKTKTDTVTIRAGFLEGSTNVPALITFVDSGFVDEFEIEVDHNKIVGFKHGRDAISFAFDGFFEKRYYRSPETIPPIAVEFDSTGAQLPPPPPAVVGYFWASQIAKEAVESIGLTLQWDIPDYEVQKTFFAGGRIIDTIKKLIRPYTTVSPFQADIISSGSVLVIKQRKGIDIPPSQADYNISMKDMKREQMTCRVRKTNKYRRVNILGRPNDTAKDKNVFVEGTDNLERTDERFDSNGKLIERIFTQTTISTPSKNTLRQIVSHYTPPKGATGGGGLRLTSRQITDNNWEAVSIANFGPVAQKKLKSSIITGEGYNKKGDKWITLSLVNKGFSYDDGGLETGSTTFTSTFNQTKGTLDPSSLVSITKNDIGTLLVETVTETYGYKASKTNSKQLVPFLKSRVSDQQGGFRPGGPGRAQPQHRGNDAGAQLSIFRTVDADGWVDVSENFPDLTLVQIEAIMQYYFAASYVWEYEVIFQGVHIPWIQRGQYIKITDIQSEDLSDPIVLPVMLVADVQSSYTEDKPESSKFVNKIRCIGWSQS